MLHKVVNVGVIGVGSMGQHHARVFSELAEAELVAVADPDRSRRQPVADRYRCQSFADFNAMLETCALDAVSVAVPSSLHHQAALACIERRLPVLIEKPLADTLAHGKEIVEAAARAGVMVAVGHIERFNPAIQKLKTLIQHRQFSKINSIFARRVGVYPPRIKDTNIIVDLAIHDIDVCNYLLGKKPIHVYTHAGTPASTRRLDFANIVLRYDGVDALIQTNWITPVKIRELHITGSKTNAEVNYISQTVKVYENNYRREYESFGDFMMKYARPRLKEVKVERAEPLRLELRDFIRAVRLESKPLVTALEGLHALRIALKAVESYEKNRIVALT